MKERKGIGAWEIRTYCVALLFSVALTIAHADSRDAVITVRIHDYVDLSPTTITRAQERVTTFYRDIGVGIRWQAAMRPNGPRTAESTRIPEPNEVLVMVLNSSMTRRIQLPEDA